MATIAHSSYPHSYRVRGSVAVILILGMAFVLALSVIGVAVYALNYSLILPGIHFRGMELGGMTQAQAAQAINQAYNEKRTMELTDGKRTWSAPLSSFGLWLDPNIVAQKAYDVGRKPLDLQRIIHQVRGEVVEIAPVIIFNPQVASDYLQTWGAIINQSAQNASLDFDEGQVEITPAKVGEKLESARTLAELQADPGRAFFTGKLPVYFTPVQPEVTDLTSVADQIKALQAIRLRGAVYDPITDEHIPWDVDQKTIDSWILVQEKSDHSYDVSFNRDSLVEYLQNLESRLSLGDNRVLDPIQKPKELADKMLQGEQPVLLVRHLPTEYTAQGGESMLSVAWQSGIPMWRLIDANPNVNQRWIPAGTKLVIPSLNDLLPLPVILNKRIVISITDQRMWVYQDGDQIKEFVISTGIADSPTQPGVFQVQTHELNAFADSWDLWMPHWMGIYEAWPGFMNGIHGLPMLANGVRLWKNVLGSPASFGCIILDLPEAEWLYGWAESGVVVEIRR